MMSPQEFASPTYPIHRAKRRSSSVSRFERRWSARDPFDGRIRTRVYARWRAGSLALLSRLSRRQLVSDSGPVVTLTSYGRRLESVHVVLESIGRGTLRPSRLILWVDPGALAGPIPTRLRRMIPRGLEISELPQQVGPHGKYYGYVLTSLSEPKPFVTADDDIIYPRQWLELLADAHAEMPEAINCFRAHVVSIKDRALQPYSTWPPVGGEDPSLLNFATGVSGVIYPASFARALKERGTSFLSACPKADDLWLHNTAVKSRTPTRQISQMPLHFWVLPSTWGTGLAQGNVLGGGNDEQLDRTYGVEDINVMTEPM